MSSYDKGFYICGSDIWFQIPKDVSQEGRSGLDGPKSCKSILQTKGCGMRVRWTGQEETDGAEPGSPMKLLSALDPSSPSNIPTLCTRKLQLRGQEWVGLAIWTEIHLKSRLTWYFSPVELSLDPVAVGPPWFWGVKLTICDPVAWLGPLAGVGGRGKGQGRLTERLL